MALFKKKAEKLVAWIGDSKEVVKSFPEAVQQDIGYQIHRVQAGDDPTHWSPMERVGPGACEICVQDKGGWYRVLYVAKLGDLVYVLHAFQKKTNQTSKRDIEIGKKCYSAAKKHCENARTK